MACSRIRSCRSRPRPSPWVKMSHSRRHCDGSIRRVRESREVRVTILKRRPFAPVLLALVLTGTLSGAAGRVAPDLPSRLSDQEFWKLTEDLSEPNGAFRSENLLSNEMVLATLLPQV